MWTTRTDQWNSSHTELTKYFIEKIKQQVDPSEIISNKHRTTNGLTLIIEVINLCTVALVNEKYIKRLMSLIEEARETKLKNSITNDYILSRYFRDIVKFYSNVQDTDIANKEKLSRFLTTSEIHLKRIAPHYHHHLNIEFEKIDFTSTHFETEAKKIDDFIECYVPYLLYIGYSAASIGIIALKYVTRNNGALAPQKILRNFSLREYEYRFLLITHQNSDELEYITRKLRNSEINFSLKNRNELTNNIGVDFPDDNDNVYLIIEHECIDPHTYCRELYDSCLKNYVYSQDRLTLSHFNNFFDRFYWRFFSRAGDNHKYSLCDSYLDPINVHTRRSTLRYTLEKYISHFNNDPRIPSVPELAEPIYFYNLALGSKSIENSLSLLWTVLEILLPYRKKNNDIQNAQYFISKYLSVGSIQRQLMSFIIRGINTDRTNENDVFKNILNEFDSSFDIESIMYTGYAAKQFTLWLSMNHEDGGEDPYDKLQPLSNLLCYQFTQLNNAYLGKDDYKVSNWIDKIKTSELSISYQLDRIYLHRNQIVHTGALLNEYSNLWSHLEWYVGKILSYLVITYIEGEWDDDYREPLLQLEADNDQLLTLLNLYKDKTIKELYSFIDYELVFKHSWQSF